MEMIKVQMKKNYFMALDQKKRKILENIDGSMNIENIREEVPQYEWNLKFRRNLVPKEGDLHSHPK